MIYDITPFTALDYPKKLAAIFWFSGCNLHCSYCYNPDIVRGKGNIDMTIIRHFLHSRLNLLDGIVLSGGEPTLSKDLEIVCQEILKMGFSIKLDTNGTSPEKLLVLLENKWIDYIALDFKAPPKKWNTIAKGSSFETFEKSLDLLVNFSIPFEIRTTVHPSLLSPQDVQDMSQFLRTKGYTQEYYLQPYHHTATLGNTPQPPQYWYNDYAQEEITWRI